jgi:hypothetical protein
MPRLQDPFVLCGQIKQFVGLLDGGSEGLLDKQIESGIKQH